MEKVKLNNGIEMPCIGFGTYRMENNSNTQQAVEEALSVGYRYIDTAAFYDNEESIGKAIKNSGIPREEIFITTKLWNDDQRSGQILEALQTSLDNLDTDYIDLYLIHWPIQEEYIQTWKVFEEIYELKRVKAIGVSNFKEHHIESLKQNSGIIPAVNQVEIHPYFIQQPLVEYCQKENIQVMAWSPFGAGKTNLMNENILINIADKYSKSVGQIILRWNYQRGIIAVPKASGRKHMEDNLDIFDFSLSYGEMEEINSLNKQDGRIGADPDSFNF